MRRTGVVRSTVIGLLALVSTGACGEDGRDSSPTSAAAPVTTVAGSSEPATSSSALAQETATLRATALWGDPCPSDSVPPDPACAPRPMAGVTIVVSRGSEEVARRVTASDGTASFAVPAGTYLVVATPVDGYRITPKPVTVSTSSGSTTSVELRFESGRQ